MKTTSWNNNKDNTTIATNRCYIDPDPFNSADGTLRNNYRLYSEYIDKGNGTKYPEIVVNWAGGVPTTIRVGGFESVDFYACNAGEIIPPLVDQKKKNTIYQLDNTLTKNMILQLYAQQHYLSLCVAKMLSTFDYVMLSYAENKFAAEIHT